MKAPDEPSSLQDHAGPDDGTPGRPGECYVVFSVDMHGYALPVEAVHHVLPMPRVTRVPTESPHVLGVFHYDGRVLALWDLHTLFGADGPPPERPSILVVEHDGHAVGLLVAQVDEVVSVEASEVVPSTEESLPAHVSDIIAGWLRVPDEEPGDEAHEAAPDADAGSEPGSDLQTMLAAAGRPDRGAAVLALLAPVHLIDTARLLALGAGERTQEVRRPGP